MYPKGEKFKYNNSGYVLLAMIIEKTTGMYFDQYLKDNVFDICGMKSTGYYELDRLPANCANNYIYWCGYKGLPHQYIFCGCKRNRRRICLVSRAGMGMMQKKDIMVMVCG